ncbi:hypothetical protein [Microbacterium sp. P05]|uniref:hypothetical protein n=1 Tax=Microbacterium sp. P05 TaxID=3366948 RepID=UPI003745CD2F
MTQADQPASGTSARPNAGLARAAWVLAGAAILLSILGVFWLRLWIPGLLLGVVALVLAIVAARRAGRTPLFATPVVLVAALAFVLPAVIAVAALGGWIGGIDAGPAREELQVELRVQAEGDFSVSYTQPPADGDSATTITDVDATDEFETSFMAEFNSFQLQAVIAQSNLGPQEISCEVIVNDVVLVERAGDRRYVDCSADLQDLYREHLDAHPSSY